MATLSKAAGSRPPEPAGGPPTQAELPQATELLRALSAPAILGAAANVVMQLAQPPICYGVMESTVASGRLFDHPGKRTRTTLTYLSVAVMGTPEDKRLFRRAVNRAHAAVRSRPESPVRYNAFDKNLQLWVAACLYRGFEDAARIVNGDLPDRRVEAFYRQGAVLGATLQVPSAMWPKDREAFEAYWQDSLRRCRIDPAMRAHLLSVVRLEFLPKPASVLFGSFSQFYTTGFLPEHFRREMQLPWSPRQQRLFDMSTAAMRLSCALTPRIARELPYRLLLADMRLRARLGKPLV